MKGKMQGLAAVRQLRRTFGLVWESGPGWFMAGVSLQVVRGLLPLAALYLLKLLIDAVSSGVRDGYSAAAFQHIVLLIALAGLVALATVVVNSAGNIVTQAQSQAVTDHVHDLLHAKSVETDLSFFESPGYFDTLHRAQRDAAFRPANLIRSIAQLVQSGASVIGILALVISYNGWMALGLIVALIPGILARSHHSRRSYHWQRDRTVMERRSAYLSALLTADIYARELRLFGLGAFLQKSFHDIRTQLRTEKLSLSIRRGIAEVLTQALAMIPVFAAYAYLALETLQARMSLGSLVMYLQAIQRGQGYLLDITNGVTGIYEDQLFVAQLFEFLDQDTAQTRGEASRPFPRPLRTGIRVDHLSFRYPGSARQALTDVSLAIQPGETVALVGRNGSGKTTLLRLMMGMYEPLTGSVTYDGLNVREIGRASLWKAYAVVLQDYACYNMTVRENIHLGQIDAPPDDEAIHAAARASGADAFIQSLPDGYDTVLGKWFEDGEQLSAGQWQKIALARAFLRNADVIALDEPTSAMDAISERELFERLLCLSEGRTTLLVSHRLSNVWLANRIVVLDEGRIVESGTHGELMDLNGLYAALYSTQARQYLDEGANRDNPASGRPTTP